MENYIKTVLYAYPLLKTVGEDYAEHIRNKAVLSYNSPHRTEDLAEYLAEEILRKDSLLWLKSVIEKTLGKLNDTERALIETRYFGKKKIPLNKEGKRAWSERKYFRCQQRLGEKISGMLTVAGVTKDFFDTRLRGVELIRKIHRYVESGKASYGNKESV